VFTISFVMTEPLIVTLCPNMFSPETYKFVEGGTPGLWTIALNNFMSSSLQLPTSPCLARVVSS